MIHSCERLNSALGFPMKESFTLITAPWLV
jgi:hypothetical protein